MTYPTAIVIAAALFAGAILASSQGSADTDDGVALAVADGSTVWVGRDGGAIRVCRLDNRGSASLSIVCSDWTP
jgi:hypothetical protein